MTEEKMPSSDSTQFRKVQFTVTLPEARQKEFAILLLNFISGNLPSNMPLYRFGEKTFREVADELLAHPDTSFALKKRVAEDENRDPIDALTDAELLHSMHAKRLSEVMPDVHHESASKCSAHGIHVSLSLLPC